MLWVLVSKSGALAGEPVHVFQDKEVVVDYCKKFAWNLQGFCNQSNKEEVKGDHDGGVKVWAIECHLMDEVELASMFKAMQNS